jgi:hypothetical protein
MNYLSYKAAFSALVQENDGVLPDLYETVNITIFCHPAEAPAITTVADVVAYAIIEASDEFRIPAFIRQPSQLVPASYEYAGPYLGFESILELGETCPN